MDLGVVGGFLGCSRALSSLRGAGHTFEGTVGSGVPTQAPPTPGSLWPPDQHIRRLDCEDGYSPGWQSLTVRGSDPSAFLLGFGEGQVWGSCRKVGVGSFCLCLFHLGPQQVLLEGGGGEMGRGRWLSGALGTRCPNTYPRVR